MVGTGGENCVSSNELMAPTRLSSASIFFSFGGETGCSRQVCLNKGCEEPKSGELRALGISFLFETMDAELTKLIEKSCISF